jgi:hypothetical protein
LKRKRSNIQISWGQRKNEIMSQQSPLKLWLASSNDKNLLRACSDQLWAMLFKNILWPSEPPSAIDIQRCTWRTFSCHHHLKKGYWLMWVYNCIWMNDKRMQFTKADCGAKMYLKNIFMSSSFEKGYWSIGHIFTFEGMIKGSNSPRLIVEQRCTWRKSSCRYPLKYGYRPMWAYGCN